MCRFAKQIANGSRQQRAESGGNQREWPPRTPVKHRQLPLLATGRHEEGGRSSPLPTLELVFGSRSVADGILRDLALEVRTNLQLCLSLPVWSRAWVVVALGGQAVGCCGCRRVGAVSARLGWLALRVCWWSWLLVVGERARFAGGRW